MPNMPLFSTAINRRITVAVAAATAATCSAFLTGGRSAYAQGTTYRTSASFGAINYEDRNAATASLYGSYYQGGRIMEGVTGETTYSFGEGSGTSLGADSDTIRLSGSAWGSSNGLGFNDLKAGVSATLANAYLDLRGIEDAPEIGNGSKAPYYWIADASAAWTMTSKFNGFTVAGNSYTVKWIFGVDGVTNSHDTGYGFAYMGFNYGANPRQGFSTTSLLPQQWATTSMPVMWGEAVQTRADFHANWQYNLLSDAEQVFENDQLIGYRAAPSLSATVDYASTMKLEEIQVFDQNGNRFYDFTVEDGDNNRIYSGNAVAVPESGTLGLVCLGILLAAAGLSLRRHRRDVSLPNLS